MNSKLLFIFVCVLISFVLFGCKKEGINFYRESGVDQYLNEQNGNASTNSSTTTRSKSGVYIYKDNSVKDMTGGGAKFGPKDINFDINIK